MTHTQETQTLEQAITGMFIAMRDEIEEYAVLTNSWSVYMQVPFCDVLVTLICQGGTWFYVLDNGVETFETQDYVEAWDALYYAVANLLGE